MATRRHILNADSNARNVVIREWLAWLSPNVEEFRSLLSETNAFSILKDSPEYTILNFLFFIQRVTQN